MYYKTMSIIGKKLFSLPNLIQKNLNSGNLQKMWAKVSNSALFIILLVFGLRTFILDWSVVPSGSMSHTFLTGDVVMYWKCAYGNFGPHSIPIIGNHFIKNRLRNTFITKCKIKRADIVVFAIHGSYLTKRVIGLPGRDGKQGDLIEWNGRDLKINGKSTIFNEDGTLIGRPVREYILCKDDEHNTKEVMNEYDAFIPTNDGKYKQITILLQKKVPEYRWCSYRVPPGHVFVVGDNRPRSNSFDCREFAFGDVPIASINGKVFLRMFGSNAKIFKRNRPLIQTILMFPISIVQYIFGLNPLRFGMVDKHAVNLPAPQVKQPLESTEHEQVKPLNEKFEPKNTESSQT